MKHNPNNTHETLIWNFEDRDPNKKILMSLQYALDKCSNVKTIMFHVDGIFPQYRDIFNHMVSGLRFDSVTERH